MNRKDPLSKNENKRPAAKSKRDNYFADTFGKKVVKKSKEKFGAAAENKPGKRVEESYGGKKKKSYGGNFPDRKKNFGGDRFDKENSHEKRNDGDRKDYTGKRNFSDKKSFGERRFNDKNDSGEKRTFGERKNSNEKKNWGEKRNFDEKRSFGEKKSFGERKNYEDKKEFGRKPPYPKRERSNDASDGKNPRFKENNFKKNSERFHDKSDLPTDRKPSFKKYFDNENPYEKAYSANDFATPKGKSFNPNKGKETEDGEIVQEQMPLNKYIAHSGVCSRRDAVNLIKDGKIKVDGETVLEPGFKMQGNETVELNGKRLTIQKNLIYILMNKPKGYITTTDDPKGRSTVMDILSGHIDERVFPVGRLDRNTTGLLLLTNDGELAQKLTHPKYKMRKIYQVTLDKDLLPKDFETIKQGVVLEDGKADVDDLAYLDDKNKIGIEIHSGKNRIVRRIFESVDYTVDKLDRVVYAGLTKKNILRGKWRFLSQQEIINLKHIQ